MNYCNMDIKNLPNPYKDKNSKIKAILLGADPTNNGIRKLPGLIKLETVFGIDSEYEKYFFSPHKHNLEVLNISKENLYIQNLCRNYFKDQTSKNKGWEKVANIWIELFKDELKKDFESIPILVTAEKIMKVLIKDCPKAENIYNKNLFSLTFEKHSVYALYRHPKYNLSNWHYYSEELSKKINY